MVMTEVDVAIRRASGIEDYLAAVELQKEVWGDDAHVATLPMLLLANKYGGCVLVAGQFPGRLIGFSFAILGSEAGKLFWWSHMTAVGEGYRNKNVGWRLKLKQRQEALASGIEKICWTFDPLQAVNAHFNIHKLGVVVRKYESNVYGVSGSPLHRGLPTDRLIAEWNLNSERVRERIGGENSPLILRDLDRIPRISSSGHEPNLGLNEDVLLLEAPGNVTDLKQMDLERARRWQQNIRTACQHYFAGGFSITDFIRLDRPAPEACYLFERSRESAG